jgi:hypothetical protein
MVNIRTRLVSGVLEMDGQPLTLDPINQVASGSIAEAMSSEERRRIEASQVTS